MFRWWRICLQCRTSKFNPWVGKFPWRREWLSTSVLLPENPMDRGAWWATVHEVARVEHNWVTATVTFHLIVLYIYVFSDSSVAKESACNAGDPSLIPGLGRSPGEAIGYPLQYSWTSLVAQLVKNLPAMWETWVWSLGWEDPLKKGKATNSSTLAWRIPWTV